MFGLISKRKIEKALVDLYVEHSPVKVEGKTFEDRMKKNYWEMGNCNAIGFIATNIIGIDTNIFHKKATEKINKLVEAHKGRRAE